MFAAKSSINKYTRLKLRWRMRNAQKVNLESSLEESPLLMFQKLSGINKLIVSDLVEIKLPASKNLKISESPIKINRLVVLLFMHWQELLEIDLSDNGISTVEDSGLEGISDSKRPLNRNPERRLFSVVHPGRKSNVFSISYKDNQIELNLSKSRLWV